MHTDYVAISAVNESSERCPFSSFPAELQLEKRNLQVVYLDFPWSTVMMKHLDSFTSTSDFLRIRRDQALIFGSHHFPPPVL